MKKEVLKNIDLNYSQAGKSSLDHYSYVFDRSSKRDQLLLGKHHQSIVGKDFIHEKETKSDDEEKEEVIEDIFNKNYKSKLEEQLKEQKAKYVGNFKVCSDEGKCYLGSYYSNIFNNKKNSQNIEMETNRKYMYHIYHHGQRLKNIEKEKKAKLKFIDHFYHPNANYVFKKIVYTNSFAKMTGRNDMEIIRKLNEEKYQKILQKKLEQKNKLANKLLKKEQELQNKKKFEQIEDIFLSENNKNDDIRKKQIRRTICPSFDTRKFLSLAAEDPSNVLSEVDSEISSELEEESGEENENSNLNKSMKLKKLHFKKGGMKKHKKKNDEGENNVIGGVADRKRKFTTIIRIKSKNRSGHRKNYEISKNLSTSFQGMSTLSEESSTQIPFLNNNNKSNKVNIINVSSSSNNNNIYYQKSRNSSTNNDRIKLTKEKFLNNYSNSKSSSCPNIFKKNNNKDFKSSYNNNNQSYFMSNSSIMGNSKSNINNNNYNSNFNQSYNDSNIISNISNIFNSNDQSPTKNVSTTSYYSQIRGVPFKKMLSRQYVNSLHYHKKMLYLPLIVNYSSIDPKPVMKVSYGAKIYHVERPKFKGIGEELLFNMDKVYYKYNNHFKSKAMSFGDVVGREVDGSPFPSYMNRRYDRNSVYGFSDKSYRMNNFSSGKLRELKSSFLDKKSFNKHINRSCSESIFDSNIDNIFNKLRFNDLIKRDKTNSETIGDNNEKNVNKNVEIDETNNNNNSNNCNNNKTIEEKNSNIGDTSKLFNLSTKGSSFASKVNTRYRKYMSEYYRLNLDDLDKKGYFNERKFDPITLLSYSKK